MWLLEVTPVLHHGNGGIRVNASSEVLAYRGNETASILLGLFAVGEAAAGTNDLSLLPVDSRLTAHYTQGPMEWRDSPAMACWTPSCSAPMQAGELPTASTRKVL